MLKKSLNIILSCLFACTALIFRGANAGVNVKITNVSSIDSKLWINETEIDADSKFYLGMPVKELLDTINDEGLEINTNSPYAAYSQEGIGTNRYGAVFVDVQPFNFWIDSENRVKYINVNLAGLEAIGGTTKTGLKKGMTDKEIEERFGPPIREYSQDDVLLYLYKFDGYYIEFSFDIGQAALERKERSDWEPRISHFNIMRDIQDCFELS